MVVVVVVAVVVVEATVQALAMLSVTSVGSLVISPATALVEHQAKAMVVVAVVLVGVMVGGGHNQTRPALHVVDMVGYLQSLSFGLSNTQHRSHVTGLYTGPKVLQLCVVLYTSHHPLRF